MSEGGLNLKFGWLDKLKRIKHIEIYILILFVAIIGLIFFSSKKQSSATTNDSNMVSGYVINLENKLEKILSNIDGVSNVSVMITLDTKDIVIDNSSLKMSSFPSIKGVIITAKGVDDTGAKMKVLHAVETVIDVTNHNVQIFSSN